MVLPVVLAWCLIAAFRASLFLMLASPGDARLPAFAAIAASCAMWALVTALSMRLAPRVPHAWRRVHLLAVAGLALSATLADALLAWVVAGAPAEGYALILAQRAPRAFATLGAIAAVALLLRIRSLRLRALAERAESATELADAENALRAVQLHPHFLFNTLAMLAESVRDNRARGLALVQQLGRLARHVARLDQTPVVLLDEELAAVRDYFALLQERFGYAAVLECTVEGAASRSGIPPLVLQPLVENALRHGLGDPVAGGVIRIAAHVAGSTLVVAVQDSGPGPTHEIRPGTGLSGVAARLSAVHPNAGLSFKRDGSHGLRVELRIPQPAAPPGAVRTLWTAAPIGAMGWRRQIAVSAGIYMLVMWTMLLASDQLTPALLGAPSSTPALTLYRMGWTTLSTLLATGAGWLMARAVVGGVVGPRLVVASGVVVAHVAALVEVVGVLHTAPPPSLVLFVRFLYVSLLAMVAFALGATWHLLGWADADARAVDDARRAAARLASERSAMRESLQVLRESLDAIASAHHATDEQLEEAIEQLAAAVRATLARPEEPVGRAVSHLSALGTPLASTPAGR